MTGIPEPPNHGSANHGSANHGSANRGSANRGSENSDPGGGATAGSGPDGAVTWWSGQSKAAPTREVAQSRSALEETIERLGRALRWVRLPAWLIALLAILPAIGVFAVGIALPGWWRLVPLLAAGGAIWVAVAFLRSALATVRAARDPRAVRRDAVAFARHVTGSIGVLAELDAVVRGSRIGLLPRLAKVWRVVRIPQAAQDYLASLPALSWLVPPRVMETWARMLACLWAALATWVVLIVLVTLVLSPAV